jgi:phage terminase large subunit GpA-like protein
LVTRAGKNGFRKLEWVKTRDRNEALDCRVYARAATAAMGMDGWSSRRWDAMADAMGAAVVAVEAAPVVPVSAPPPQPVAPAIARPGGYFETSRQSWF